MEHNEQNYHLSVLLPESIEALNIQADGIYVDLTFGGGGHSRAILAQLGDKGRLYAFDQDIDALQNVIDDPRFKLLRFNFKHLQRALRLEGVRKVNGVLADLGVSSHQFNTAERGFSYRFESFLDMRMNQQEGELTAQKVLHRKNAEQLQQMFSEYGEIRNAKTLAQAIIKARQRKPIETVQELLNIVEPLIMGHRYRYLGQVFQALRMEVNDELGVLKEMLSQTSEVLAPQGRLAVITFHSLEDKIVKNWVRNGCFEDQPEKDFYGNVSLPFKAVHKKPVEPSKEEIAINSRAHSAKLRVAERVSAS